MKLKTLYIILYIYIYVLLDGEKVSLPDRRVRNSTTVVFLTVYFKLTVDDSVVEKYLLPKEQVLEQENLNERVSSRLEGD